MDINKGGVERSGKENNQATLKESTAQWVNRAFGGNVTTNISCQDVLSLSLDTMTTAEQEKLNERLNFSSGKLWSDQVRGRFKERRIS